MDTRSIIAGVAAQIKLVGEPRGEEAYTKILPFCTVEALFHKEKFVSLDITEHYHDPELQLRSSRDVQHNGLRKKYRTYGDRLEEVILEGVLGPNQNGEYIGVEESLYSFADSSDGRENSLHDLTRFGSLLRYVQKQLS